jgi:hypothetical protein
VDRYRYLRQRAIQYPGLQNELPRFVRSCRTLDEFWSFIKLKFPTYQARREFLRDEFEAALTVLETSLRSPIDSWATIESGPPTWHSVKDHWRHALERRHRDPEGAITAAKALLESVCKCVLDESGTPYGGTEDLPKLYRAASQILQLAPDQHSELEFRKILGGCTVVVEGLGSIRNSLGDAHGKGLRRVRPGPRHAELAVNLAGSMASFLMATWEFRRAMKVNSPPPSATPVGIPNQ